jgi:HlyD family secretion protein
MGSMRKSEVEVTEESKKAGATDKPAAAKVNENPGLSTKSDKPEKAEVLEEPQKTETTDKPALAKANEKPDQSKTSDKPEKVEVLDRHGEIKKVGKVLLYVLPAILALILIWYKFLRPPTVHVTQVQQQDYTGEIQGTGTVNVAVLAAVGAKIPGRIASMLVDEGDVVHAGQVVATLEDTDVRQVLKGAQDRLQAARMVEQAASAKERSARAQEEERGASKYQAGRAWEREKHLLATGAVSQEEADQYQEHQRTAKSAVVSAQAETAEAGAKAQAAHSGIAAAEAEVRLQQFNLSQTQIFTYVSGIVTDRPKRLGDSIVSGEAVVKIADPSLILVEAYLDQRFARDVRAGQTATVTLRGRPKERISGRVYRVRPQADPAAEEMTVEIAFPLPAAELQIGQWADVYVAISQTKSALVVPKTAVFAMGDDRVVLVADANNKVRQVKVESIASSPRSQVMAVKGEIKIGDWVLTEPMGIKPGQKIRPDVTTASKAAGPAMGSEPFMKM